MSDQKQPAAEAAKPENAQAPAEWKPEPRQWTWKDLFTAPMLAFKPKCMLASALTLVLLGLWAHFFGVISPDLGSWWWPVFAGFLIVGLAVFGLGATFVAVFMKADLLDDEFLSLGEAVGQFKGRALAAVMVPLFLVALAAVAHGLLIWLPMLVGSIPYAGAMIYGLLYPLGFCAAVFCTLLSIAVVLSLFVFPAIVAIRRHGWFDNVVDTIEAVGTRPHVLVASLILAGLFMVVAFNVSLAADRYLREVATTQPTWGSETGRSEPARVDDRGQEITTRALSFVINPLDPMYDGMRIAGIQPIDARPRERGFFANRQEGEFFHRWIAGMALGFWQTVIGALVLGYCLNLFIGGGMLTYLVVREDDYWDDEDLEDLDKLAKELEEEAKREEAGQAPAAAVPAAPAPAAAPTTPATPPASVPPAAAPGAPAGETLPTQIIPPKG